MYMCILIKFKIDTFSEIRYIPTAMPLKSSVNIDPEENYYDIILKLLATAKEKHLPKKMVKFDRRKQKKGKWVTNGLLKSINTKDKL